MNRNKARNSGATGLTVIAEGMQTAEELTALPALGFDDATGSAVPRN